jgi:Flavodoxin reductases (ferredoxin-NADPH reductases) family 1
MSEGEIAVRVRQMRYEADTILSIGFETLDGAPLPRAEAGAHVDLLLTDDLRRSYSLTEALDGTTPACTVAVHRDPNSRGGSAHVHEVLRVGQKLKLSRPKNNFPLDEGAAQSVLIAGGIGITPMLAMIRRLTALGRPWHLHYAARKRSAAAFLAEIDACLVASGGQGRVTTHFDDEAKGALIDIPGIVAGAGAGAHFYCCGPEPMLAAYEAATKGTDRARVHAEYFSAKEEAAREGGFEVVLARSGKTLQVEAGKTILDVLIANRVSVPFACTEGTCGTCETRVLEGRPDHRDMILTDEERARNDTMMVCCSGSKTARLVLDL